MELLYIILGILLGIGIGYFLAKKTVPKKVEKTTEKKSEIDIFNAPIQTSPEKVRDFYNEYNSKFVQVYGEVIQAFRTKDVTKLLDYQIGSIGFEKGMTVLDAGCGVCGPASHFAKNAGVNVEAITISDTQIEKAKTLIARENVQEKVNVQRGDYHLLPEIFPRNHFDITYFLESFGHSYDQKKVLKGAWDVLKPGGILYIKDLFRRISDLPGHQKKIDQEIDNINKHYRYNVADLYTTLHEVRKLGFVITALKTIDIKLEDFENLTISNDFQELTGIAKIEDWNTYIFPIEFYELKCYKPVHDLANGTDKYFFQNMMYMQLQGVKEEDL